LQRTLKTETAFEGIGLHTGRHVIVRLKPAPRDSGIVFYRTDKGASINANIKAVCDTAFATTLGSNGTRIKTVEHILAALSGLGIDNLLIELNGSEIPILDGSSSGFVDIILKAGVAKQASKRPHLKITKPLVFKEGNSEITALPYNGRMITFHIFFNHHLLGEQQMSLLLREDSFIKELAPARTFGFLKDVEYLRANGFAKGGSLENAIIIGETEILNASGLRFKDEFLRHKMLDFIGDISLLGFPIYGHIIAKRSGHTTNLKFLKALLQAPDCWEIVTEVGQAEAVAYS
jgi:UDP-3-O-[3-hydroxymyristoyl] N-acetylglucosamine deacetylase